jgi:F-type H+-transporting ATPase subunit epsilon
MLHSYIQYSNIAARLTRRALKADIRVEALKREEVNARPNIWKDGKPATQSNDIVIFILYPNLLTFISSFLLQRHKVTSCCVV